ncbi:MAG: hypothetical protein AB7F75_06800 [Planctomycetota bacterium]
MSLNRDELLGRAGTRPRQGSVFLRLIKDRRAHVEDILQRGGVSDLLLRLSTTAVLLLGCYGFVMGLHVGFLQGAYSAAKLPLLFLGTLLLCFPALYLLTVLAGMKVGFFKTLTLALSALLVGAMFLSFVAPISLLFTLGGASREFLTLFHSTSVLCSCLVMAVYLGRELHDVGEHTDFYPPHATRVLVLWVLVFAFVGGQVAWMLKPFVGDKGRETQFVRDQLSPTTLYYELKLSARHVWEKF